VSGAGDFQLGQIDVLKDPCPVIERKSSDEMDTEDNKEHVSYLALGNEQFSIVNEIIPSGAMLDTFTYYKVSFFFSKYILVQYSNLSSFVFCHSRLLILLFQTLRIRNLYLLRMFQILLQGSR
jgi:hypothetical protein